MRRHAAAQALVLDNKERTLIERAQGGDREAFEELVEMHDRQILSLTFLALGNRDEARDAYQEIFLKAYRAIDRFRFESSFYTWIYRIARNVCFDHLRKRETLRREIPIDRDRAAHVDVYALADRLPATASDSNPERSLLSRQIGEVLQKGLQKLTRRERLVFELRHYHGLRLRVIGEMMGMSEDTAKNCLYRGTQKLRAQLAHLYSAEAAG
jgi:RNA polymerase sigma-70 factor (ECF subfamily)